MIKGFTKLQCVGGRFLLTTLPSLVAIHAFQSLGVVADSITGPPQSDAAFAIRGTAIKTLWNFWSLMRVGAPLDLPFELIPLPSNSYANILTKPLCGNPGFVGGGAPRAVTQLVEDKAERDARAATTAAVAVAVWLSTSRSRQQARRSSYIDAYADLFISASSALPLGARYGCRTHHLGSHW